MLPVGGNPDESQSERSIEFRGRECVSSLRGGHLWSPLPMLAVGTLACGHHCALVSSPLEQEGMGLSPRVSEKQASQVL